MNERGHNTLIQAGLTGHTQVFNVTHGDDGDCAMGVLHLAMHAGQREEAQKCFKSFSLAFVSSIEELTKFYRCSSDMRSFYSISMSEQTEIVRLNDEEHLDFIGIARKLYRPTEEGG